MVIMIKKKIRLNCNKKATKNLGGRTGKEKRKTNKQRRTENHRKKTKIT